MSKWRTGESTSNIFSTDRSLTYESMLVYQPVVHGCGPCAGMQETRIIGREEIGSAHLQADALSLPISISPTISPSPSPTTTGTPSPNSYTTAWYADGGLEWAPPGAVGDVPSPLGEVGARGRQCVDQPCHVSWVVRMGPGTDAMGEISSGSTFYRPPAPPW